MLYRDLQKIWWVFICAFRKEAVHGPWTSQVQLLMGGVSTHLFCSTVFIRLGGYSNLFFSSMESHSLVGEALNPIFK